MTTLVGVYTHAKGDWYGITEPGQAVTNLARWKLAHASFASNITTRSYNFNLNGQSISSFVPDADATNEISANAAGVAGGSAVTGGYDFLTRGNYVHPDYTVFNINSVAVPAGLSYYAGSVANFTTPPLSPDPSIARNWVEVLSTSDLDVLIPLVDGNTYTINLGNIKRTALGTTHTNLGTTMTIPNITLNTGDILRVYVAANAPTAVTLVTVALKFNGHTVNSIVDDPINFDGSPSTQFALASLFNRQQIGAPETGSLVGTTSLNANMAMVAVKISGCTNVQDNEIDNTGSDTNPTSGPAVTLNAVDYIGGYVATAGPSSDAGGTWGGGFIGGQSDGSNNGSFDVSVSEGYQISVLTGTFTASKSGITSRNWVAVLEALKG